MIDILHAGILVMGSVALGSAFKATRLLLEEPWATKNPRFLIAAEEDFRIIILSGEANPIYYRPMLRKVLWKKGLKVDALVGPQLLCTSEDHALAFSDTGELKYPDRLLDVHPLLRAWRDTDRFDLWVRRRSLGDNERHFMVGIRSGICYSEDPHELMRPQGGFVFRANKDICRRKLQEFRQLRDDPNFSVKLTAGNFVEVLSRPGTFIDRPSEEIAGGASQAS